MSTTTITSTTSLVRSIVAGPKHVPGTDILSAAGSAVGVSISILGPVAVTDSINLLSVLTVHGTVHLPGATGATSPAKPSLKTTCTDSDKEVCCSETECCG